MDERICGTDGFKSGVTEWETDRWSEWRW